MGIFSGLLIAFTVLNLACHKRPKEALVVQTTVTIIVFCFINAGYFFSSDLINIDQYQGALILEFVVVIYYVIIENNKIVYFNKTFFYYIISLTISFLLLLLFPSISANVTGAGQRFEYYMAGIAAWNRPSFSKFSLFFFVLSILLGFVESVIFHAYGYEDWKRTIKIISRFAIVLVYIVILEIILKYNNHSQVYYSIIKFLFGTGTSMVLELKERGYFIVLQGMTREASHFVFSNTFLIICLFVDMELSDDNKVKKTNKLMIVLLLLFEIISGGFSMIISIIFLIFFYMLYIYKSNKNKDFRKQITTIGVILLIGIGGFYFVINNIYLYTRMLEVFKIINITNLTNESIWRGKAFLTSSETRFFSLYYTFIQWFKRPFFGLGEGTTECYSTVVSLAEIGLCGICTFFWFISSSLKKYNLSRKRILPFFVIYILFTLFITVNDRIYLSIEPMIVCGCYICVFYKENNIYS